LVLSLIAMCSVGAIVGYRQFFDKPTATLTPASLSAITSTTAPPIKTPVSSVAAAIPPTATRPPTLTPQPTRTAAPTATSIPTATPAPSPTPCTAAVYGAFSSVWQASASQLGCASSAGKSGVWIARENFEHGLMFWREDNDKIYVLYDNGYWGGYDNIWQEGDAHFSCGSSSPPTPQRGFGKVWCTFSSVRQGLGDATNAEWGEFGALQEFNAGLILQTADGRIYTFYNDGTWRR